MSYLSRSQQGLLNDSYLVEELERYPDYRARTNNVILTQYQVSTNLKTYISAFVDVMEDLEWAATDVIYKRYPQYATAAQLDDVATIVGAKRVLPEAKPLGYFGYYESAQAAVPSIGDDNDVLIGGILKGDLDPDSSDFVLSDGALRNLISAKVVKNSSYCNVEDVILFIETWMGRTMDIEIIESTTRNAADIIIHETLSLTERAALASTLKMMKAASIEYTLSDNDGMINLVGQSNTIADYNRFLESLQI